MERTVKQRQKARYVLVSPASSGWRINEPGEFNGASHSRLVKTLGEVAAAVPADREIHLALPCDAAILERLHFPTADAVELGGMVRLQLEKTLPYPPEEITSDFEIVERTGTDSVLVAAAVNNARLNTLCQPLRESLRLPRKITVFVMHVAATCAKGKVVFVVYKEDDKLVAALCENARPVRVQTLPDAQTLVDELSQLILSAELEGVPTNVAQVRLDKAFAGLESHLHDFFGAPVDLFSPDSPMPPVPPGNLLPVRWKDERLRLVKLSKIKERLIWAGVVYAVLLIALVGFIFVLGLRTRSLERKLEDARPALAAIKTRQDRWNALAPAFDPRRSVIKILNEINKNLPSDSVRVTSYQQTLKEMIIEIEAPTASVAIEFVEILKKDAELSDYQFSAKPPAFLPNGHASMRIFGRL